MNQYFKSYLNSPPIILYRFGHYFYKIGFVKFAYAISLFNRLIFSTWIPCSAKIGKNFKVGYMGLGVVIHSNSIIGDDCLISQNVTIGKKSPEDLRPPILNNNIYIGVGAVLIGEINIGSNVIIGANTFVNKSIPNNSTIAGNPFKYLTKS